MFNKKNKTDDRPQQSEPDRLVHPHTVAEIQAAILILNDAIYSGQLPTMFARGNTSLCLAYLDRGTLDHGMAVARVTQVDAKQIRPYQDIQAEERAQKEHQLQMAKEQLEKSAKEVERLARELGIKTPQTKAYT